MLKINCTLELPEDFRMLCEIFDYPPEGVLQRFMEDVSFPVFFTQPDNDHRWATLFFLYNMGAAHGDLADNWEDHKAFMDRMARAVQKKSEKAEADCRKIMTQWNQWVLRKRADDLLKGLSDKTE